jgi:beta-galactosidase
MWPQIFASMKASGLNTVDSYVFWNYHVRSNSSADRAHPDYSGRGNVTLFLQLAAEADLFVIWRLGPYINAEWLFGGYPAWVRDECRANGYRKAVQPYMELTTEWMTSHVETVRPFFATNGGPIILLQVRHACALTRTLEFELESSY